MGKNNNAPATAGATPEELEAQRLASEAEAEAKAKEEAEAQRLASEAEAEAQRLASESKSGAKANKVEVIPSNIFVAEDGTEVEFAVKHFIYNKRKYTPEEAVAEIPEALQELYERKSFIFKKV